MAEDAIVRVRDVFKSFGANAVLKGVSFDVRRGEMVAVLGRSGSGKSTMLRCLNALEAIQGGEIVVCDNIVSQPATLDRKHLSRSVGFVFQSYNLFPHLTVLRNITLALTLVQHRPKAEAREIAYRVLNLVGLDDKAGSYPDRLSGGQQQRVAIARSLALTPQVMLFDEVTSALDPELTAEVLAVMEKLARDGMTMILVTHELGFARRLATTTIFMNEGRIWEQGSTDEVFTRPQTTELRQFLHSAVG